MQIPPSTIKKSTFAKQAKPGTPLLNSSITENRNRSQEKELERASIIELTIDHKPHDLKEKDRIKKMNGDVKPITNRQTGDRKSVV